MATPHVGDLGTQIQVTLTDGNGDPIDLSDASEMVMILQDPEGTSVEKTATFTTDGADGGVQYETVAGDLAMSGKHKVQARVTLPTGTWWSTIGVFKVADNLGVN